MDPHPIILKNVRVHNLKGIDLILSSHEFIVFTGVSGSGKSSMAFDTLFVEGQRRYIESLSTSAKRSLGGEMQKPAVDVVLGLSPTVAIEQKSVGKNPRSTVGTLTEVYDYLRLLFARIALPHCPISGKPVTQQSQEEILQAIQRYPHNHRLIFLAPFAREKKGEFKEECAHLVKKGFLRARIDRNWVDLDEMPSLDKRQTHTIDVIIDRVSHTPENHSRMAQAVIQSLEMGAGLCLVIDVDNNDEELLFSTAAYSKEADLSYPALEPGDFSFNSPSGMCPECHGLGMIWGCSAGAMGQRLTRTCPACQGSKLKPYPSAAKLATYTIQQLCLFTIQELHDFFSTLFLTEREHLIAAELVRDVQHRLHFLIDVGLHYLHLDRTAPTLSGGEAQRVRLASQIGSGLTGVTYVLDEPSIGLHPCDQQKLIVSLKHLRDLGNTVIVVEHDEETIRAADRVVDFGPGPGRLGGTILVNGRLDDVLRHPTSLTGAYLSGRRAIPKPECRRSFTQTLTLHGAKHNNLQNCTLNLPLGVMTVITGVSGSGKSSLICETLQPALHRLLHRSHEPCGAYTKLTGTEHLDKVIAIDQSPIGRTPRSNPATYIKLFDDIRALFSALPESCARGYSKGRFSFNVQEGACTTCRGIGMLRIDMDFLEDQWVTCPSCHSHRFDLETLSITYKGKNIYDVLAMTVSEALELFASIPAMRRKLELLQRVGLDYLTLGQSSTTLSGGEAQRIKLAKELVRPATGRTLYILDEPTTGLHMHDVAILLSLLNTLIDKGNTLVIIEHNVAVIEAADWVIDLGPEAGASGGCIVAEGTPEFLATQKTVTGYALACHAHPPTTSHTVHHPHPPASIRIVGAAQNNLRTLDLSIPRGKITVCTGPSGSGKSSLAFETVYAEGQRRYIDSLSPYARQFVKQMPQPKVHHIDGLSPAISIEQKASSGNPRSTVGTQTEIYDYLRLLFAKVGVPHSPLSGLPIERLTVETIVSRILGYDERLLTLLAPLTLETPFPQLMSRLQKQGFLRIRLDGTFYELDAEIPFEPKNLHTLALVLDRVKALPFNRTRITEAVETCMRYGQGTLLIVDGEWEENLQLPIALETENISPHLFSFNHAEGMCPECQGLGMQKHFTCTACTGTRLNLRARHVLIRSHSIASLCQLPLTEVSSFLEHENAPLFEDVMQQIRSRLKFLCDVGLGYLSLDRTAPTLSQGEAQRIRLARQLGSQLTDVLYVLDEPTVGLHPHDNVKLNDALKQLQRLGNTLLLVEHDPLTISCADHIIEFGPGAGREGGALIMQGTYQELLNHPTSLTGAYLSGRKTIASPTPPRPPQGMLPIFNACTHNLKQLTFNLPIGGILCTLTGVSGSGKSTLMHEVIAPLVAAHIRKRQGPFDTLRFIDQQPIGHTSRADVSTYTEIMKALRSFYSQLAASKIKGLLPKHFSTNHRRGMCTHCAGMGYKKIDRLFLPPVRVVCEQCRGMRLNPVALSITYEGFHIGHLLQWTIDQIYERFHIIPKMKKILQTLQSVGLGYLTLGQELISLSGGEAQRLKLSAELAKRSTRNTLFLLDEPTTGLHPDDIHKLLTVLNKLVDQGNTCILIEHNIDLIRASDIVIDLGPGAGSNGGTIVAMGTPDDIARHPTSITGKFLSPVS